MRIALFSDVHGNLTALEAVLEELERLGPLDRRVCAGDVAFLGPSPAEVIERLREEKIDVVRGNTDDWLTIAAGLPRDARIAGPAVDPPAESPGDHIRLHMAWCLERLGRDHLAWLNELPLQRSISPAPGADLLVVHATPESCHASTHLCAPGLPAAEARAAFGRPGARAVAFGHRHEAFVAPYGDLTLVNVAPVSITLDRAPAAALTVATWHGDHWTFQQRRIVYDPEPELRRARERDLPHHPWWESLSQR
ncbi:MAG: metallophosphoesterase family protein [Firmicutes bacterium]|nr:metallophosphoesterase family protein [Bacillota bacterium]